MTKLETPNANLETIAKSMTNVILYGPTRVLCNRKGYATTPDRAAAGGVEAEVIFIRHDGWSLGAPLSLIKQARRMWEPDWIAEIRI